MGPNISQVGRCSVLELQSAWGKFAHATGSYMQRTERNNNVGNSQFAFSSFNICHNTIQYSLVAACDYTHYS